MAFDASKPAIWTTRGNINTDALEHFIEWSRHGDSLKVRFVYTLDGEIVREDAHVHVINGLASLTEQESLV